MTVDHPKAQYHLAQMQRHEELIRKIQRQAAVGDEDDVPPVVRTSIRWVLVLSLAFIVFVAVMYKAV